MYLDRGVRTVQRWEVELGLPVRRPFGHSRSTVLALRDDLCAWLQTRPRGKHVPHSRFDVNRTMVHDSIAEARRLRGEMSALRETHAAAVRALIDNLSQCRNAMLRRP